MSNIRIFKKGELFFQEGDTGSVAYIIHSGIVEVSKKGKDKKKVILANLEPGDIFGEMCLITGQERAATVTALEDTTVTLISREGLESVLRDNPQYLNSFLKKIFQRLIYMNQMVMAFCSNVEHNYVHANISNPLHLTALTKESERALHANQIEITKIPFHIGRKTDDGTLDTRDLSLWDEKPFTISRHHCTITMMEDQYILVDADSAFGTVVDGIRLGKDGQKKSVVLNKGVHRLILGSDRSPFIFDLDLP
jgi:CRP-like cAMP-binding protein